MTRSSNKSPARNRKKKKQQKPTNKKLMIALTIVAIAGVTFIAIRIWVRNTQITDWKVCGKGEMLEISSNTCVSKPKVVNGIEEGIENRPSSFKLTGNNGEILFQVSSNTMIELFAYHSPSMDYENAPGDEFIYIDPTTNTFERATLQEVQKMKNDGIVCLDAKDAWDNIGKDTCVSFTPNNAKWSGNHYFLNEQQEYRNGFVAAVMVEFTDWDSLTKEYFDKGAISVYGTIEKYEGHPEIKIYASGAISTAVPIGYSNTYGIIYKNTRKYP